MRTSFGYAIEPKKRIRQHNAGATNRTTNQAMALRGDEGWGDGWKFGGAHLVASRLLRPVKGAVGGLQEVSDVRSMQRISGDAK